MTAPSRPGPRASHLPTWWPVAALAAVCYVPLLLTHRGQVGADTKSYLYLDPDRLLGRAWSMWDPNVGMGTVPHQNIGYLWPMGPWFWTFERLGIPDWIAQRLWLGSILFLAGMGVRYMLRSLGQSGPGVAVAMFLYALCPYVLTLGARISALLLPFTALGWMLGLTIRAVRERGWLHPALFALAVPTFGSTNATALLLVGIAPALWVPYATFVLRELRLREALAVTARIGVLTLGASLWWIVGLWCQGSFGMDVLRYTETARTVAQASTAPEVFRSLGYWYFYGDDKLGPWIEPSAGYTQNPLLITITYAVPVIGLLSATLVRWRYRAFFVGLVIIGVVLAVGAHPWDGTTPVGSGFRLFLTSQVGLAMRSLPRAVPIMALGLSVLTGSAVAALGERARRWERPSAAALIALAIVALPPLWLGQMVANNLQRSEELPDYWTEAAAEIDARGQDDHGWSSRVLEVPGADFASYRWGDTVDPITPGITDRPYVARELIPYGTPPSADLLNAFDRQLQEGVLDPEAVAPVARLMGAGDVVLRGDLAYERYNLVRPRQTYALLEAAPDLGPVTGFGSTEPNVPDPRLPLVDELELGADPDLPDPPAVGLFTVEGAPTTASAKPESSTVLLAGNGDGIVAAASAGLLDGFELIRYSGSFAADGGGGDAALQDAAVDGALLVVTDTNRRSGRRWGAVHETDGATEEPDESPLQTDWSDNRLPLFPGAGPDSQTVSVQGGGLSVRATSYGNSVTYTPEDRPTAAFDDDPATSWYTAAFTTAVGERIEATYDDVRTTDRIRFVQADRGNQNRWITGVQLRFDGGDPIEVSLTEASRTDEGQWITFPEASFTHLSVEVTATDPGRRDSYDDLSAVGFADIRLGDGDRRVTESIRPPVDLLDGLGAGSTDHPLAVVLTRMRARASSPLRSDEEPRLVRTIELPDGRSFTLDGWVRLSAAASDAVVDRLIGRPTLEQGGVEATSSRRLPGDLTAGAAAAVDGDPTTHWSPGFLGQVGEWTSYALPEPVTFDHMDLRVVTDGRHSVPTRLRIRADGEDVAVVDVAVVDVPALDDAPEKDATTTVRLELPEITATGQLEIVVDGARDVLTNDWISKAPVIMPVGISEWGVPGLAVEAPEPTIDTGCRRDLLSVDGEPVAVRVTGPTADALAGEALPAEPCAEEISLGAGTSQLSTGTGAETGLQVDRLLLRSAAGGAADTSAAPGSTAGDPRVPVTVTSRDRWRFDVEVDARDEPTWLVIGQSHNLGWHASIDGEDLGEPVLVDGYSSGFLLPPGTDPVTVSVVWNPQRAVFGGLAVSAATAAFCLALVGWVLWRRRQAGELWVPGTGPRPLPLDLDVARRSPGATLGWPTTAGLALAAVVAGWAAINLTAGLLLALAAILGARVSRARPILSLGPAALVALSGAYVVVQQVRHGLPPGFGWPERLVRVHGVAYAAVLLLTLELVVGWLRRAHARPASTLTPSSDLPMGPGRFPSSRTPGGDHQPRERGLEGT